MIINEMSYGRGFQRDDHHSQMQRVRANIEIRSKKHGTRANRHTWSQVMLASEPLDILNFKCSVGYPQIYPSGCHIQLDAQIPETATEQNLEKRPKVVVDWEM